MAPSSSSSSSNTCPSSAAVVMVQTRTHMNHGGGAGGSNNNNNPNDQTHQHHHHPTTERTGGSRHRHPLQLGMDSARASQNILRLLESSHGTGTTGCADTFSSVWHPQGQIWRRRWNKNQQEEQQQCSWHVVSAQDELQALREGKSSSAAGAVVVGRPIQAPSLDFLELSDDRTALVKIVGADGLSRYISLLKLDAEPGLASGIVANDGWHILREVVGGNVEGSSSSTTTSLDSGFPSLAKTLGGDYFSMEHGGGGPADHKQRAMDLFSSAPHQQSSLITVGVADPDDSSSSEWWSAPAGTFLGISLEKYLEGVLEHQQAPHGPESKTQDAIVSMDILPCQTAAAATVHVGNGACTNVFVNHLLLGKRNDSDDEDDKWCILSKTFSVRHWPSTK
jgi:hypothetical protein